MASMLSKLRYGVRLFGSEAKRREAQAEVTKLVATPKLQVMKLLMKRTGIAEFATLCPAVKVGDLPNFLVELVEEVRQGDFEKGSLQDPDAPRYGGLLRVVFGADKGGGVTRFGIEMAASGLHLVGMFSAHDSHENMERFLEAEANWSEQMRNLLRHGLTTHDEEGKEVKGPVQVVIFGDKSFLSEIFGLQGSAATYPILYDLTPSTHLRKAHRDGSPHLPSIEGCQFPLRTVDMLDKDYYENRLDTRQGGNVRKNGSKHNSVVAPRKVHVRSLDDVAVAILHVWLRIGIMLTSYATLVCRILDGNATRKELAGLTEMCEAQMEEPEDEGEEEDDDQADLDREEIDEELTPALVAKRAYMMEVEAAWTQQAASVAQLEQLEVQLGEELKEKDFVLRRIKLLRDGDRKQLEKEVKKKFRVSKMDRRFVECGATCLLTRYDREVATTECTQCEEKRHILCEVAAEEEIEDEVEINFSPTANLTCRECSTINSFDDKEVQMEDQRRKRLARMQQVHGQLGEARLLMSAKRKSVVNVMGKKEQELERVLVEEVKVKRTDYASGCWVGNHVDKIVEHFEKVCFCFVFKLIFTFSSQPDCRGFVRDARSSPGLH